MTSGYHDPLCLIETLRGGAWTLDIGRLPDGRFAVDHFSAAASGYQRLYFDSVQDARAAARSFLGIPV